MAYTAPTTVSVGDAVTASLYNTYVKDNIIDHESRILLAPQRIETVLLTSTGNISFSSIPQTYSSLRLIYRVRAAAVTTAGAIGVRFNGDTASNYSIQFTQASNATVTATAAVQNYIGFGVVPGSTADASNFGTGSVDIPQYSSTTTGYKGVTGGGGSPASATAANSYQRNATGQWHNTAAITSIQLVVDGSPNTLIAGSYATLIGMP